MAGLELMAWFLLLLQSFLLWCSLVCFVAIGHCYCVIIMVLGKKLTVGLLRVVTIVVVIIIVIVVVL